MRWRSIRKGFNELNKLCIVSLRALSILSAAAAADCSTYQSDMILLRQLTNISLREDRLLLAD